MSADSLLAQVGLFIDATSTQLRCDFNRFRKSCGLNLEIADLLFDRLKPPTKADIPGLAIGSLWIPALNGDAVKACHRASSVRPAPAVEKYRVVRGIIEDLEILVDRVLRYLGPESDTDRNVDVIHSEFFHDLFLIVFRAEIDDGLDPAPLQVFETCQFGLSTPIQPFVDHLKPGNVFVRYRFQQSSGDDHL